VRAGLAARSLLLVIIAACSDGESHIYAGRLYEAAPRDCLDEATSVDVVDGDDPGFSCPLTCIVVAAVPDGGPNPDPPLVYVSAECPPYPTGSDTSGTMADCPKALAASLRSDICQDDGGSSNPIGPDAGNDASSDAASDTGVDAGVDAADAASE